MINSDGEQDSNRKVYIYNKSPFIEGMNKMKDETKTKIQNILNEIKVNYITSDFNEITLWLDGLLINEPTAESKDNLAFKQQSEVLK